MTATSETATAPAPEKSLADQLSAKARILEELTACEARLKEARTKTEDLAQGGAPVTTPSDARLLCAFSDLEGSVHDLRAVASIAEVFFDQWLKELPDKNGWHTFHMPEEAFDRLEFAVSKTSEMAFKLDAEYQKTLKEAQS